MGGACHICFSYSIFFPKGWNVAKKVSKPSTFGRDYNNDLKHTQPSCRMP